MTPEGSNPSVAGRKLGDFTIQCELGRGGMGVVYRARQESMGRIVALKTLPSFIGMDHDAVARFRREAEAAGRLSHPGIVPIFAVGEAEGVHYYAMELIEGPSLSSLIESLADREPERLLGTLAEECEGFQDSNNRSMSLSGARYAYSCASIVADLASALTTAHRGMVIHRDIKPSNVLIRETGTPVLVDFGLARDEMSVGLTQSGDALGTPAYMAPEQARGEKDLDARVDIYGLGALLYEMLTLRPPFDGAHPGEIMRKIVESDPIPVRQLNPRVPVDLEKIVHTCLAKRADDRYAAAEALEMDLRAFLDGREVVARKPRIIDRLSRILRRDRRAVAVGAAVLCVSAMAFGVVGVVADRRSEQDGRSALADALQFGKRGDVQAAQEAYGRALALLDPADVDAARIEHLPVVFEELYGRGEFDVLRDLLGTWPGEQRGAAWSALDRRLRGVGALKVAAAPSATVELRRVDEFLEPWRPFASGESLPIGDVLVRVAAPGHADVVHRVAIERDRATALTPESIPDAEVPIGHVVVVDPFRHRTSFVARHELSREAYARLLDRVDDPDLRRELTPTDWVSQLDRPKLPVVDLSFAQARTVAALFGFHVLSEAEYRLAANCGIDELRFPWGASFDARNVAANPNTMNEPLSVHERLTSASPHGILNLVGNVAEMLSPGVDSWRVPVAGGHFQSEESELTCASRAWFDRLGETRNWAGVRIARFVSPPPSEVEFRAVEQRVAEMFETGHPGLLADWSIRADGCVDLELRTLLYHGDDYDQGEPMGEVPLVTPGFAQTGAFEARDGHDRPLVTERVVSLFGEDSKFVIESPRNVRKGQQYRHRYTVGLEPRGGLTGRADTYTLHVPLRSFRGVPTMTRASLPSGTRVDFVEPAPDTTYHDGDREVLVWYAGADTVTTSEVPAVVRFRRDGMLSADWPSRASIESAIGSFVDAVNRGDRAVLETILADEFRQKPHGRYKDKVIAAYAQSERRTESIGDWELIDAVPVGPIVTTWVEFDWRTTERNGDAVVLRDWPMRVLFRREPTTGRFELLELAPAGRADAGTLDDGVYRHPDLWLEFSPPPDEYQQIRRLNGRMTDLQVSCFPRQPKSEYEAGLSVEFSLFGIRASQDVEPSAMQHLLTNGEWSMRQGVQLAERTGTALLGGLDYGRRAQVYDWHFQRPTGWHRDRWTLLRLGRRWFLSRARAAAPTKDEADALFRRYGEFFDKMATSVSIREKGFDQE